MGLEAFSLSGRVALVTGASRGNATLRLAHRLVVAGVLAPLSTSPE